MKFDKLTSVVLSLFIIELVKCSNDNISTFVIPSKEITVCAPCKECHDCDLYPEESYYCPSTCKKSKCYNDVYSRLERCFELNDISIEKFEPAIHYSCSKYGCNQAYNNENSGFSTGYCHNEIFLDLIESYPENVSDILSCRSSFTDESFSYHSLRGCSDCEQCNDCDLNPEHSFYCPTTCMRSKCATDAAEYFGQCTGNFGKYEVYIELICGDYVCTQAYKDEDNPNTIEECHEHIIHRLLDRFEFSNDPESKEELLKCKVNTQDPQDIQDPQDPKDTQDPQDPKDTQDPQDPKDTQDPQDPQDPKDTQDPQNPKDTQDPKDYQKPKNKKGKKISPKRIIAPKKNTK